MAVLRSYSCGGCGIRMSFEHVTPEEPERLLQIVRDLHGPHCPAARGKAAVAADESP